MIQTDPHSAPGVLRTKQVRALAAAWARRHVPQVRLGLGLPEWDMRRARWRVALLEDSATSPQVGELYLDATGVVCHTP